MTNRKSNGGATNTPGREEGGAQPRKAGRILLVENRAHSLERAAEVLEGGGYEVETAVDAAEAVARIGARRPDLILIGSTLPGMDGNTLAMHLKAEPATRDIRIVAWKHPAANGARVKIGEGCIDGCIVESGDAKALPTAVHPYLAAADRPVDTAAGDRAEAPRRTGLRILLADDNTASRELLATLLTRHGHFVVQAAEGQAALKVLGKQKIDVVITDALMPMLDGYQLCHKIRRDPRLKDLPVIIFSGVLLSTKSETLASALGAVRFLRKPASAETVITTITEVVMEAEARRIEAEWSGTPDHGPGEKVRHLVEELDRQNRNAQEMNEKLLQAHHELLVLSSALEESEENLRQRNAQLEEDMQIARETHFALLPRTHPGFPSGTPPAESALRFHQRFTPKGSVSGDFFDYAALSDTNAGVFICDVMGHGVGAALVTAVIRGMLVEVARSMTDPSKVLSEINRALAPIMRRAGAPMFASAFYMTADAASGEIQYANAGHPNPFLLRRDQGRIERIGAVAHGPALGLMPESRYQTSQRTMAQGDLVMMFTDGIFEVNGRDESLFGEERLLGAVHQRIHLPSEQLFEEIIEEVREFSSTKEFGDDLCLLGMEVDHLC